MLDNLIFSLNSTMPLFFIMALGYVLYQRRFLTDGFVSVANKFVFNITLPVMLFCDLASTDIRGNFDSAYVGYCAGATVLSIVVVWALAKLLMRDKSLVGEFVQACYRSSAAILGTAFIQNLYGTSGMAGLMILGSVPLYNIFAVLILVLERPAGAPDEPLRQKLGRSLREILTNPTLLGVLTGLAASLLRLPIPTMAEKTMASIGSLTSPLALLAIGAGFRGRDALAKLAPTAAASFIKLMVLPGVFLPLAVYFGFTDQKLVALIAMLGSITTPSAYIMAKQMGHDGTLTGSVCAVTTVFSALTMTFWMFWARSGGYIL